MEKYILIKNKNGTQENLWVIIGETDTGKTYKIQSRNTYRYISKKHTSPSENNSNILIGKDKLDVKSSEIDVNKDSHTYIQDKCWKCGYRQQNLCVAKNIIVTDLNKRLANECWCYKNGRTMDNED
jgi:hypothetical protein